MDAIIKSTDVAGNLTAAQQQMVEIARVINKNAKVVIMDEPTSSLSEHEIDALFEQIRILRSKGVAIAYISHRMKEIFEICDRATVLRDGCFVRTDLIKDITEHELVASMVGREIDDYFVHTEHTRGEETLRVEGLSHGREFKNVSFTAYKGEILGIAGLVGAGRTETMETIFGARHADSGKVFVRGKEVHFKSPKDAIANKIGMVTEDRRTTGLMLKAMIKDNEVLPSLIYHMKSLGFADQKWIDSVSREYVGKLRVKTPSVETIIGNLSGGNQQKVVLAKWLIAQSEILILDEPTRGIDVNAKSEFYTLMSTGLKAYEVKNGPLTYKLMADKCLDMSELSYKGVNFSFLSKPGLQGRNAYDTAGAEAIRGIMGGMFFTCGVESICAPCNIDGVDYPMHGRLRTTPGEHLGADAYWEGDDYHLIAHAEMREAALFGENMVLRRSIDTVYGEG